MSGITAMEIKKIRELTNGKLSLAECKAILIEADGNMKKATMILVEKGIDVKVDEAEYTVNLELSKPHGIIVFGLNGSGKTTLGRELARVMNFKYMDIEDYHFLESEIPYTNARSRDECLNLMLSDIKKHRSFIISAVTGNFGEEISSMYMLAVYITAPIEIRLKRIKQREYEKHGGRVLEGGDMHEQQLKFLNFVSTRSIKPIEQFKESLVCPIISVNGIEDYRGTAIKIARLYEELLHQTIIPKLSDC